MVQRLTLLPRIAVQNIEQRAMPLVKIRRHLGLRIHPQRAAHPAPEVLRQQPIADLGKICLLYTSPSPRDATLSRMPSSA